MKPFIKIFIIITSLLGIFPLLSNAQHENKSKQKKPYLRLIDSIVNRSIKSSELKDSIALYAINFSIDLIKNNDGKTSVTKISANDSLAYKLFPAYTKLYSINYTSLLGTRKKIRLVIPILISNISDTANKKYKKEDGSLLIDMQAAVNAAYSLYSTISYNNTKEAEVPVDHRIYKSTKDSSEERLTKDIVYLTPYVIQILNTK